MHATERHDLIAGRLREQGRVRVAALAREFRVTEETIRRDLTFLEHSGKATRVHGGAVPVGSGSTIESTLKARIEQHAEAKRAIAEHALAFIPAGASVFLDAGSSTLALARLLAARGEHDLTVLTNSIPAATALSEAGRELEVVGGTLRGITRALVGPDAVQKLQSMRFDLAFLGTNGVSVSHGFSTPDQLEAATKRAIVRSARRVVVLADGSKFERELVHRFAALEEVDMIITDEQPAHELREALDDAGVEVSLP